MATNEPLNKNGNIGRHYAANHQHGTYVTSEFPPSPLASYAKRKGKEPIEMPNKQKQNDGTCEELLKAKQASATVYTGRLPLRKGKDNCQLHAKIQHNTLEKWAKAIDDDQLVLNKCLRFVSNTHSEFMQYQPSAIQMLEEKRGVRIDEYDSVSKNLADVYQHSQYAVIDKMTKKPLPHKVIVLALFEDQPIGCIWGQQQIRRSHAFEISRIYVKDTHGKGSGIARLLWYAFASTCHKMASGSATNLEFHLANVHCALEYGNMWNSFFDPNKPTGGGGGGGGGGGASHSGAGPSDAGGKGPPTQFVDLTGDDESDAVRRAPATGGAFYKDKPMMKVNWAPDTVFVGAKYMSS